MNKFIVFAVLAVCCMAKPISRATLNMHARDGIEFVPHALPCSYAIYINQTAIIDATGDVFAHRGGYLGAHDTYCGIIEEEEIENITYLEEYLFRSDLKETGSNNITLFEAVKMINGTQVADVCENYYTTMEFLYEKKNETLNDLGLLDKQTYMKRENRTFQGKEYLAYYSEDKDGKVWMFADDENYVLGYELEGVVEIDNTTNVTVRVFIVLDYILHIPVDYFVMNSNISDKCAADAYVAPKEILCYAVFEPHPLPCAYEIHLKQTSTVNDTKVGSAERDIYVHGTYYKLFEEVNETEVSEAREYVVRSDLMDGNNVTVFGSYYFKNASLSEGECFNYYLPWDYITPTINATLAMFTEPSVHNLTQKMTIKGVEYDLYVDFDREKEEMLVLFTEKGFLMAIEYYQKVRDTLYHVDVPIRYADYANLTSFVIDRVMKENCSAAAFVPPTKNLCDVPSSSGSLPPVTPSSSAAPSSGSPVPPASSSKAPSSGSPVPPASSSKAPSSGSPVPPASSSKAPASSSKAPASSTASASTTKAAIAMTLLSVAVVALL